MKKLQHEQSEDLDLKSFELSGNLQKAIKKEFCQTLLPGEEELSDEQKKAFEELIVKSLKLNQIEAAQDEVNQKALAHCFLNLLYSDLNSNHKNKVLRALAHYILDVNKYELLSHAVQKENLATVQMLVEKKSADVNHPSYAPICFAAEKNERPDILKYLFRKGAIINTKDETKGQISRAHSKTSCFALSKAIERKHGNTRSFVEFLMYHGADTSRITIPDTPGLGYPVFKSINRVMKDISPELRREIFENKDYTLKEKLLALFDHYTKLSPLTHNLHYRGVAKRVVAKLGNFEGELTTPQLTTVIKDALTDENEARARSIFFWKEPLNYDKMNLEGHFKIFERLAQSLIYENSLKKEDSEPVLKLDRS